MKKNIAGGNNNFLLINIVEKKITILRTDVTTKTKMKMLFSLNLHAD